MLTTAAEKMQMLNYRDHFMVEEQLRITFLTLVKLKKVRGFAQDTFMFCGILSKEQDFWLWRERCRRIPNSEYADTSGTAMVVLLPHS